MKKNIVAIFILVTLLTTTLLTGCDNKETNTASPDQTVVSTEKNTTPTENEMKEETVVPTEKETEADDKKSEVDENSKNKEDVKDNSPAPSNTSNKKSNASNSNSITNKKPSSNTNSASGSANTTTTTKKPSSNSNTNTNTPSTQNKPSTNTNKKPSNNTTKPATKPITDDTKLTHTQFSTPANMQRICNYLNSYYQNKGMKLDTSFNINNKGWMFGYQGCIDKTAVRSYNQQLNRIVTGLDEQIDAAISISNYPVTYNDITFHCYAEKQSDGEYNIYFCYC